MTYTTEASAAAELTQQLSNHFSFFPEVTLLHPGGNSLRIDFVGLAHIPLFPAEYVGFEIKRRYDLFTDYTAALKQCIDYRHSTIEDPRLPLAAGLPLSFVFLFPNFDNYAQLSKGAEHLAGKFNVGIVHRERGELVLRVNGDRLWSPSAGLRADAASFSTNRHPGARKGGSR